MITVFTSCYNQGNHLEKAIESVLDQSYSDFEYLLYDDGSTDNTWDIMDWYARSDDRITAHKLDRQANVGVVINKSIEAMQGDVWVWCPSDDTWKENLLEVKHKKSEEVGGASVIYSAWNQMNEIGRYQKTITPVVRTPREFADILWTNCPIGFTGIWIPKSAFDKAGVFPIHLDFSEDYYWMLKAAIDGVPFVGVPDVLYWKRVHDNRTAYRYRSNLLEGVTLIREDLRKYKDSL